MTQFGGFLEVVGPLGGLDIAMHLLDLGAKRLHFPDNVPLAFPLGFHRIRAGFQVRDLFPDIGQPRRARLVLLFRERRFLDLKLHDPTRDRVELRRH
ncbi:MAG: hypothetical protein BWY66_01425 [bacterium ADurb.Bin374]|nr:MAG: hypothetical protein BWY66_01425 [bacterium ADurb.Bin374]